MELLITGSVAFDYLMTFPGKFREHILLEKLETISLSFLVDSLVRRRGGIAPNIAYTYALLGGKPKIFATVGEDFEEYRDWLEQKGIDTSWAKVISNEHTASFFATTDQENSQMASFYPGAMSYAADLSLKDLENKPDLVFISPNDPGAMEKYLDECKELGIPYAYDPSQQVVRVEGDVLCHGLDGAAALFLNEYELELVMKKTGMNRDHLLDHVKLMVVTLGEKGASVFTNEEEYHVNAVKPDRIIDPTGAGDAFRGGFLTGYRHGWDWETCAQMGALAATYCLESDGPQGHTYSRKEYLNRYRQHYDDHGLLDVLI
ncbi:MAG: carbohydrate kinase family protein [Anaerolineales bacterium]|jgi:adenosine kinase